MAGSSGSVASKRRKQVRMNSDGMTPKALEVWMYFYYMRSYGRWFWMIVAAPVVLAALWYLRNVLLLIYVSAIFAIVLKPAVDRLHRTSILGRRPGRGAALLLLIAGGLVAFIAIVAFA